MVLRLLALRRRFLQALTLRTLLRSRPHRSFALLPRLRIGRVRWNTPLSPLRGIGKLLCRPQSCDSGLLSGLLALALHLAFLPLGFFFSFLLLAAAAAVQLLKEDGVEFGMGYGHWDWRPFLDYCHRGCGGGGLGS